nr:Chain B, Peroxisome proliferator-activated receptor gamma coactivator 1-alpha [Homo sapiens]
SLLKKLLLAP